MTPKASPPVTDTSRVKISTQGFWGNKKLISMRAHANTIFKKKFVSYKLVELI